MNRRRLLGWLGSLGTAGLAGCGGGSERRPRPEPRAEPPIRRPSAVGSAEDERKAPVLAAADWELEEIIDVTEAGADRTGTRPVGDVLSEVTRDGRLLYFPPGVYRMEEPFTVSGDQRVGLLGDEAVIKPPQGFDGALLALGYPEPLSELFVRGFTFDFSAENTGARPILAVADDRVELRGVRVEGVVDVLQDQVRLDVTAPDGQGIVEQLQLPDGSSVEGVTGCEVGENNHGDISFVDCHIEGFPDNGLYADPPEGSVTVDGGFYRNNGVAGIRIETSGSSVVRGAHVVCDDADATGQNMRGIRLRAGESLLVEDSLVELLSVPSSDGAITFHSELESATVRNSRLHVDADGVNALRVKSPTAGASTATRSGPFRCENVLITGNAAGGAAVRASNRNDCTLHGLCIHQPGYDRDGIDATYVRGELVNAQLAVTGSPLSLSNSQLRRRNVSVRDPSSSRPCYDS